MFGSSAQFRDQPATEHGEASLQKSYEQIDDGQANAPLTSIHSFQIFFVVAQVLGAFSQNGDVDCELPEEGRKLKFCGVKGEERQGVTCRVPK
jgi:hypothetical protein